MDDLERQQLTQIITKLEDIILHLKNLQGGVETKPRMITEIEKYVSNSGNTTWKAYCDDGELLYIRQSMKAMLVDRGVWDFLNDLQFGALTTVACYAETIPDGDFQKIIKIERGLTP